MTQLQTEVALGAIGQLKETNRLLTIIAEALDRAYPRTVQCQGRAYAYKEDLNGQHSQG